MDNSSEFRKAAHQLVDWIADYYENIEQYPVKSKAAPGDIKKQLPHFPPRPNEPFEKIFQDFQDILLPGITHWQNPNFFAYFPANSSFPSLLGEMLTAALGAQCMIWDTSPAAAELEEVVMNWLKSMLTLPKDFHGVIQDTASTATLCALLTAREKYSNFDINKKGFYQKEQYRIYCSKEAHSSIDKAVKIAGFGIENLHKIGVNDKLEIDVSQLTKVIEDDISKGYKPLCVVAALGTTSTTAIDPIGALSDICNEYDIWLHVDGAFAGSALILPEMQWMSKGLDKADSFVFNPHKWLFTNFDCSAYFVRDKESLIRTFEILPEYLKTKNRGEVNDYRDWGVQLGRRFRALKLWFVIRSFGVTGLQNKIRKHISLAQNLAEEIDSSEFFTIMAPIPLNTICFRYSPKGIDDITILNELNEKLLSKLNHSGKIYLTHTKVNGYYTLRFVIGQTFVEEHHVRSAWHRIETTATNLI